MKTAQMKKEMLVFDKLAPAFWHVLMSGFDKEKVKTLKKALPEWEKFFQTNMMGKKYLSGTDEAMMIDIHVFPLVERLVMSKHFFWRSVYEDLDVEGQAPSLISWFERFRANPKFKDHVMTKWAWIRAAKSKVGIPSGVKVQLNNSMVKPTLGYWQIRGLIAGIRYQMHYMGVDYNMEEYEQGDGPEFCKAVWIDEKFNLGLDFPNLPYLMDGDVSMTETVPIHKFLAEKYMPELLGKGGKQKARITQISGPITELKNAVTMPCYMTGDKEEIAKIMDAKVPAIVAAMGDKKFLSGDSPCWLDFYFYEAIQLMAFANSEFYTKWAMLDGYQKNVAALTGVKEYLADPFCPDINRPFNNKFAKLNS